MRFREGEPVAAAAVRLHDAQAAVDGEQVVVHTLKVSVHN